MAERDSETVMLAVPRSALTIVAPPAERVSQVTSLEVFGLPPKAFLALVKRGAFPATPEGRLRVAKAADVRAYLDSKAKLCSPVRKAHPTDERTAWAEGAGFRKAAG